MTHNELLDLLEDLREYATGNPIDDMDEDDAEDETVADLYRRVRQAIDEIRDAWRRISC